MYTDLKVSRNAGNTGKYICPNLKPSRDLFEEAIQELPPMAFEFNILVVHKVEGKLRFDRM